MPAQEFEDALEAPDGDAFHGRFSQVIANGVSAGAASPDTAQSYLRAFCDRNFSFVRRRWVGLALCKMLQSSAEVVTHLKRSAQGLTGIGDVILSTAELEETKIVAGLIIREGLARGVKFLSFWPNDKVHNSASNFPRDAGPNWMSNFQDFLETLAGLRITERVNDRDLFFIVSVVASDGYQWKEPNDVASLLLIQREHLSIMTADPTLQDFRFVDIPLSHIQKVERKLTILHDSQGRDTKMRPWDVVLNLRPGPWTYRVNSAEHSGDHLSITFIHEEEAKECQSAFFDLLRSLRMVASSDPLSTGQGPDDVPEGAETEDAEVRYDDDAASPEETGPSIKPIIQSSTMRTDVQQAPVTRHASVAKDSNSHTTEVEFGSGTPSKPTSNNSHTGVVATRGRRESLAVAIQRQPAPSETGTLPTVRKPVSSSANAGRFAFGLDSNETFGFPEQSPRIKRPAVVVRRKSSAKVNGRANASKEVAKETTKARFKPRPHGKEVNDTEDDEDPLSQSSFRTCVRTASLRPNAHGSAHKGQGAKSGTTVPSSSLPKIAKPNDAQAASRRADSDIFAIPQDDEADSKPRVKRKRTKAVTYKDLDASEEETSGSEYRDNKRKRMRSPAKRPQAVKALRPKKAVRQSGPNGNKSSMNAIASCTESQPVNSAKPSLLSQLVSKLQPLSGAQPKKSKAALEAKENLAPADQDMSTQAMLPIATDLGSEIGVLNKLNEADSNDDYGVNVDQISEHENSVVIQKRPLDVSHPATPSRVKRAKLDQASTERDAEPHHTISVRPLSTNAPLRVLADPSSPCIKQDRRASNHAVTASGRSMEAPAKPTADQTTHTATQSRRQRMLDSRKPTDTRHTPMHQHGKRIHSGGSASMELLSSNSKPTPASPHAESTAISGHADPDRVDIEREMGEYQISRSDPFTKRSDAQKLTSFTRRLTGDGETTFDEAEVIAGVSLGLPSGFSDDGHSSDASSEAEFMDQPPKKTRRTALTEKAKEPSAESFPVTPAKRSRSRTAEPPELEAQKKARLVVDVIVDAPLRNSPSQPIEEAQMIDTVFPDTELDVDGDTLVEQNSEPLPTQKAFPVLFRSSPPPLHGSPSSHSSTSAEEEPRTDPPVPTSEAENMEWEASLQPHQRSLHEQLLRISTRVVRHVVDNETALDGIADTYARDGKHLLETLVDRHNGEFATMLKDVEKKKVKVKKSSELLLKKLDKDRQALDG